MRLCSIARRRAHTGTRRRCRILVRGNCGQYIQRGEITRLPIVRNRSADALGDISLPPSFRTRPQSLNNIISTQSRVLQEPCSTGEAKSFIWRQKVEYSVLHIIRNVIDICVVRLERREENRCGRCDTGGVERVLCDEWEHHEVTSSLSWASRRREAEEQKKRERQLLRFTREMKWHLLIPIKLESTSFKEHQA